MKTYLSHKNQIQGFEDVSETVKTVEKIAASSVHFLKQEVATLNLYTAEVERILVRFSLFYQRKDHPLLQKKSSGKRALVILTGDKGLVGGLWHGIINAFVKNACRYQFNIVIGAKGKSYFEEENIQVHKSFSLLAVSNNINEDKEREPQKSLAGSTKISDIPSKTEMKNITDYIFGEFQKGAFSRIDIIYPRFVSLAEQQPSFVSFLPFEFIFQPKQKFSRKEYVRDSLGLPIFEPSKKKIFDQLLQKHIGVFFHKIVLETKLSELSARTVAMEHAASKTQELVRRLTLEYFKERRRVVTQKQLESFVVHKIL